MSDDTALHLFKGFTDDDLAAALACFRLTARRFVDAMPPLRPAKAPVSGLRAACIAALEGPDVVSQGAARAFFATWFEPRPVTGEAGEYAFFTGYYEPVVEGALLRSADFSAPLLGRPADLVTFAADDPRPPGLGGLTAARRLPTGLLAPYPDRRTIESDMAGFRPVVWLRDRVEAFLIHVQGSARVRLADGRVLRLTYAGRNGHPYTSIGRRLIERGDIALADMTLDRLKAWLRAGGQAPGERGGDLMQANASFIFFEAQPDPGDVGPTGGAGVPLTALRSIAVDRSLWCYGLPFWVDVTIPWQRDEPTPFRRLMIAQDTGSAILGAARADLFIGSGPEAGRRAGDIRHHGRFTVLQPRVSVGAGV